MRPAKDSIGVDSDDDEDEDESNDFDVMSAKQTLIHGLERVADQKQKKYSTAELETLIFDLPNILKVLTFKETVETVLPILHIYLDEPENLKARLFT
jgi:hypothetical protein